MGRRTLRRARCGRGRRRLHEPGARGRGERPMGAGAGRLRLLRGGHSRGGLARPTRPGVGPPRCWPGLTAANGTPRCSRARACRGERGAARAASLGRHAGRCSWRSGRGVPRPSRLNPSAPWTPPRSPRAVLPVSADGPRGFGGWSGELRRGQLPPEVRSPGRDKPCRVCAVPEPIGRRQPLHHRQMRLHRDDVLAPQVGESMGVSQPDTGQMAGPFHQIDGGVSRATACRARAA